jgi:hypothetical protein
MNRQQKTATLQIGKPRPPLFRALGGRDLPARVEIDGQEFCLQQVFKHDSWAASALYRAGDRQVVCKFNREQAVLGIPMRWLGRWLARRETEMLRRLKDVPLVPDSCGPIHVDGQVVRTAAGHRYIPGSPLGPRHRVSARFFQQLRALLDTMHRRRIAYVDLHKRENILVGDDGQPYLIDFQIGIRLPPIWPFSILFNLFARSDCYHLAKHLYAHCPDLCDEQDIRLVRQRPWWIRMHRLVAVPIRTARRRLLVLWGIRHGDGMAQSEHFPEEGFRVSSIPLPRQPRATSSGTAEELAAWRPAA